MEAQFLTNASGERVGVILDMEEYRRLMADREDLRDLRAADDTLAAIERGEEDLMPFDEAVKEMEAERRELREAGSLNED